MQTTTLDATMQKIDFWVRPATWTEAQAFLKKMELQDSPDIQEILQELVGIPLPKDDFKATNLRQPANTEPFIQFLQAEAFAWLQLEQAPAVIMYALNNCSREQAYILTFDKGGDDKNNQYAYLFVCRKEDGAYFIRKVAEKNEVPAAVQYCNWLVFDHGLN